MGTDPEYITQKVTTNEVVSHPGTALKLRRNNQALVLDAQIVLGETEPATLSFQNVAPVVNGTLAERMRIHTNGYVGIGTASPSSLLHVAGTVTATAFQGNGAGLTNVSGTDSTKVAKTGDTMTGALTLSGNPTTALHAAPKQYVDGRVAKTGDTMTGPLTVNGFARSLGLSVNDASNTGVGRGLWLWAATDPNHVIYSANPSGKSPANKNAVAGYFDSNHRLRLRTATGQGFLFENNAEVALVDINSDDGRLWTKGAVHAGGDIAVSGKHAFRGSDTWLRLNQDLAFTSGVHTPGVFAPMSLNVGGRGGWGNPGDGNIWYTGTLSKLDVADEFTATVRCADFTMGHSSRRGTPGRALVDEYRSLTPHGVFQTPRMMHTLSINYARDWEAVYIDGLVYSPSSRQLKENIKSLSSEVAKRIISTLEPVRFTYKQDAKQGGLNLECLGFIAEDTPPEVASPNQDAIVMNHIIAALTRVVKDHNASIGKLEAQVSQIQQQHA